MVEDLAVAVPLAHRVDGVRGLGTDAKHRSWSLGGVGDSTEEGKERPFTCSGSRCRSGLVGLTGALGPRQPLSTTYVPEVAGPVFVVVGEGPRPTPDVGTSPTVPVRVRARH